MFLLNMSLYCVAAMIVASEDDGQWDNNESSFIYGDSAYFFVAIYVTQVSFIFHIVQPGTLQRRVSAQQE